MALRYSLPKVIMIDSASIATHRSRIGIYKSNKNLSILFLFKCLKHVDTWEIELFP